MSNGLAVHPAVSVTEVGADAPKIKWEALFPQIFKRGGEIRSPKAAFRMKDKPKALIKHARELRKLYADLYGESARLSVITSGGGVFLQGDTLTEFMAKEDDGFEDLIFAGWQVFLA